MKRKLILEGLLAFLIAMTPILFYSYKYVPITSDTEWDFLGITFTDNGYKDVSTAFYYYIGKLVPLILLIVWFITCKRWWYHAILIPITMYAFQFYSVFSEDVQKIDENEILYLLIVCMVIIPVIYTIRIKLVDKYVHGIDLEAMEVELKNLREKQKRNGRTYGTSFNQIPKRESFSELLNRKFSTGSIEHLFKQMQHNLQNWLHLKF